MTRTDLTGGGFLLVDEVAARLRVDVYTVRRLIGRGELVGYKVGRTWRVDEADLAAYLVACRSRP